jgi:hypothetical protein
LAVGKSTFLPKIQQDEFRAEKIDLDNLGSEKPAEVIAQIIMIADPRQLSALLYIREFFVEGGGWWSSFPFM